MDNEVFLKRTAIEDYQYNEAMKTLRTNIQFSGAGIQVVMLTSSVPGEGKSETTFHLAASLAQLDKKVLLIDADIRKSILVTRYQLDRRVDGLSQYLSGQKKLEEVVYKTNLPNLTMIFSGPYSPNPAELLAEPLFDKLVAWARENFDYVIIDTPPIGLVIDAVIIAHQADASLLVTAAGKIKRRFVTKAVEQLEQSGSQFLGVVLNKVDMTVDKYGSYGSYGSYGEYGKKSDQKEGHSRAHRRRKG